VSRELGVVMPYWLDRPDTEAVEIAQAAEEAGIRTAWVGEMASFDAFALATAIGLHTDRLRLRIGPLAVGVRSSVAIALGVASVATLTGHPVDIALGASSPVIVSGWHDRPWDHLAPRMGETVQALRMLLGGERIEFDGRHLHVHGFRLRRPQPEAAIAVAAFGPKMTEVAAQQADQVVLNLVTPERVAEVRGRVEAHAAAAGRPAPSLAVWVPAALDPGPQALAQLQGQLAVYLGAPGYGELFSAAGFEPLVRQARSGAPRSELADMIPAELVARVGAVGTRDEIARRVAAYHDAGADHVGIVPSTAEDPAGRRILAVTARDAGNR
jgi:probable F420-dependent oxidoreductase